jgi:hypothetical protein
MRGRASIVAVAPVVLAAGFLYHPYIPVLMDEEAVAAAAAADPTRWGLAHLTVAVGSGLLILAFLAVRSYLHEAGEDRWSRAGLPWIVVGSTMFAILPGMELALVAVAETGGDLVGVQAALDRWFLPVLLTGALTFAIGSVCFAAAIARSAVLPQPAAGIVAAALIVSALGRFVPLGAVQFYVVGAAGIVALWPLAVAMSRRPVPQRAHEPQTVPA